MKSFYIIAVIAALFIIIVGIVNDHVETTWNTFLVDHHCHIEHISQHWYDDQRTTYNCDGFEILH